jgi:hypothetical protein
LFQASLNYFFKEPSSQISDNKITFLIYGEQTPEIFNGNKRCVKTLIKKMLEKGTIKDTYIKKIDKVYYVNKNAYR